MTANRIRNVGKSGGNGHAGKPRKRPVGAAVNGQANGHAKSPPPAPSAPVSDGPPEAKAPAPDAKAPAPAPAAGRDVGTGRFVAGNKFSRGNPFSRKLAANRQLIQDAVTPEDLRGVVRGLVAAAQKGDVAAASLLLNYVAGRPGPAPDPDRLDLDEWRLLDASPTTAEALLACGELVSPAAAAATVLLKTVGVFCGLTPGASAPPEDFSVAQALDAAQALGQRLLEFCDRAEGAPNGPETRQVAELRKTRCRTRR